MSSPADADDEVTESTDEPVDLCPTPSDGTTPSWTPQAATPSSQEHGSREAITSANVAKSTSHQVAPDMEEELELFRKEWQQEILQRKNALPSGSAGGSSDQKHRGKEREPTSTIELGRVDVPRGAGEDATDTSNITRFAISRAALPVSASTGAGRPMAPFETLSGTRIQHFSSDAPRAGNPGTKTKINDAIETYALAVAMERKGDLDEALVNYRKAFRLNSNADQLYARAAKFVSGDQDFDASPSQDQAFSDSVTAQVRASIEFEDYRVASIRKRQAASEKAGSSPTALTVDSRTNIEPGPGGAVDELSALIDELSVSANQTPFSEENSSVLHNEGLGIRFKAAEEEEPLLIARLPDELIVHILSWVIAPRGRRGAKVVHANDKTHAAVSPQAILGPLPEQVNPPEAAKPRTKVQGIGVTLAGADWSSLEAAALTCWKLRVVTMATTLWKTCVQETYFPPQTLIPPKSSLSIVHNEMLARHGNWRSVLVDEPRLRLSGAYIAPCHYTREGMSEESSWVRVVHVVEFYRSLRFLPDGQALSLLTTDVPSETVRRMEPSLRMKGFMVGQWKLFPRGVPAEAELDGPHSSSDGEDVSDHRKTPRKTVDISDRPVVLVTNLRDSSMPRYSFQMLFALRQTSRGKFNKIDLVSYASYNESTGETLPLPRRHARPFIFSRVKAYGL